jgi:6-pyruvoyl-tetrahydropterin synthase
MKSEVVQEVQAALLNSSGDPKEEVQQALEAVATFAVIECEMRLAEFEQRAMSAYHAALKKYP